MNLTRCEKGHFYDADKFQSCPHCETEGMGENRTLPFLTEDDPTVEITVPVTEDHKVSLLDAVEIAVTENNDPIVDDDSKTVSIYQGTRGIEPVVGWMVCVEGPSYGESYKLKSGNNFVGRSVKMDINLKDDTSVSRDRHAVIIYEPKSRNFYAKAGESRELFYLNDEVVLMPEKLQQHDILTIGNTKLMFFPCCSEKFSWDDFSKKEE